MNKVDKDILYDLYVIRGKPMHQIAKELDIAVGSVYNYLCKYDIPRRNQKETFTMKGRKLTPEHCEIISKIHKGKVLSKETRRKISETNKQGGIGHKKTRSDGYIAIYFPDHPKSNKDGYVMEHDLIMECIIGRHLLEDEVVHHKNHIRNDNRKENLELMTFKEHAALHMRERHEIKKGGMTY
jgi:transposase